MCLLVIARQELRGWPLVVAGNRDESTRRPWQGPRRAPGEPPRVFPVDTQAGGTWIGVNRHGVVAAVTNRTGIPPAAERRSRGLLCAEALTAPAAHAAVDMVRRAVSQGRYNAFNLLVADARAAWVLAHEHGALLAQELGPGVHAVSNFYELNAAELDAVREAARPDPAQGRDPYLIQLSRVLADHGTLTAEHPVCKHGAAYGTLSSTLIAASDGGEVDLRFSAGPPCTTPWSRVDLGWS